MLHIQSGQYHQGAGDKDEQVGFANTGNHGKSLSVDAVYNWVGRVSVGRAMVSNKPAPEPAIFCAALRKHADKKPRVARLEWSMLWDKCDYRSSWSAKNCAGSGVWSEYENGR
jgi:hypothetical protein